MYDYLDLRQIKRLKELVPYKVLAPDADEIIEELERLNNIINELEKYIKTEIPEEEFVNSEWYVNILDKLKELKENKQ